MQDHVLVYVNGKRLEVGGDAAFGSLAEFLRQRGLVGTKIGCAEGDCGACSVLLGVPEGGSIRYRTVVSCLQSLVQVDGGHIVTIEGLTPPEGCNPIQQAMIDHHGSQCGFCTPGFVAALYGLFEREASAPPASGERVGEHALRTALSGNLCRCTGYLPILQAGRSVDASSVAPLGALYPSRMMVDELAARSQAVLRIDTGQRVFFRPRRLEDAVAFRAQHPGAVIISGGTELGLERNKRGLEPAMLLSLTGIEELSGLAVADNTLSVGANVTWAQLEAFSEGTVPAVHSLTERFGSPQIRNVASVVGNVAHGSPVADSLCFLVVALAELDLASVRGIRSLKVADFYHGPKLSKIAADEIITRIRIPLPAGDEIVKLYKISKRKEMDVSTFRAAIRIGRNGDSIKSAAIAYSGVGPTVRRMTATEEFLVGQPISLATFREAGRRARAEIEPISNIRGSSDFRLQLAENILAKFYHEAFGDDVRPLEINEDPALAVAHANGQPSCERQETALAWSTPCPAATAAHFDSWIGRSTAHESAHAHVTGKAAFLDDLPRFANELVVEFIGSALAHARIAQIVIDDAVKIDGIAGVFRACDVPGGNRFGPIFHDEELLASEECVHVGQPIVALAGENRRALQKAKEAIRIELDPLPAVLSLEAAIAGGQFLGPTRRLARGDAQSAIARAERVLEGTFRTGGQEHFYLETQAALAIPGEGGQLTVHSSTQNPSEIQGVIAHCLGLHQNQVVCICTRMGGGFGGKESQAAHPALLAALAACKTGRPARVVYPRELDMRVTGKRHPYLCRYRVGFSSDGLILALILELYSDAGCAADLSLAVMERSLLHSENAYFIPNFAASGTVCRTNLPSNTAMRGFGGPQGIAAIENVIEEIAAHLGLDSLEVRRRNCYGGAGRDTTPYGQVVSNNTLPLILDRLAETSDYARRRGEARRFSAASATHLKGLALVPVKFGISFTRRALNQASALVNIYLDGTIQVSTGGTEMGQGLNTKIRQLVAGEFALPLEAVRVMPSSTDRNNNTSPTAASAAADLNGTAALRACETLKSRLAETAAIHFASVDDGIKPSVEHIRFEGAGVVDRRRPGHRLAFRELVRLAYEGRTDLGARGFYATPGVDFNRETGRGNPFLYYTNGAAVSEVLLDRLTGELAVTRVDILMDLGRSLNPAIDVGQVIGGFVQGMGWATTEELLYSDAGNLLSHSPNSYKIPTVESVPRDFFVDFVENHENALNLFGSKAVGEPPFVLGLSVHCAAKSAISSLFPGRSVALSLPATSQEILKHLSRQDTTTSEPDRPMTTVTGPKEAEVRALYKA